MRSDCDEALEWINGKLKFLDQTRLPLEEFFCETDDVVFVAEAIKRLAIRGAHLSASRGIWGCPCKVIG